MISCDLQDLEELEITLKVKLMREQELMYQIQIQGVYS